MRSFLIVALLLSANWIASQSQEQNERSAKAKSVSQENSKGFFMVAELRQSLKAKKLKPGDKVKAQVMQDVLWHGRIVIPAESKLIGHVTEANVRNGNTNESRLGIVFDQIKIRRNREVDFQGVIHSLEAPVFRRSIVDEPDPLLPEGASNRSAFGSQNLSVPTVPVLMHGNSNVGSGSPYGESGRAARGRQSTNRASSPMSVGMPFGVFGIKDLSLTEGPSSNTPGPLIVSSHGDVKLDYGTQILILGTNPRFAKP